MAGKKSETKPPFVRREFVLFWWMEAPGNRLGTYRTRRPEDIEVFSENHFHIRFHPDSTEDVACDVILRRKGKTWYLKVDDDQEFWSYYGDDAENGIWTWMDEANQELFVIRGVEKVPNR